MNAVTATPRHRSHRPLAPAPFESEIQSNGLSITLELDADQVDTIARRVASLLAEFSTPAEPSGYLDVVGAAEFLACPASRLYALVSAKRIPHHRDGSRLLFDRAELREYVRNGGAKRP